MLTLTKFKRFLEIPEERIEKDTVLQEFIDDAIGEANRVSCRTLEYSEHTIYLDGTGTEEIELTEAPVYNVTELKYWNGEDYVNLLDSGDNIEDIVIYSGGFKIKLKEGYNFYKGVLNIMITYRAGYRWADGWAENTAYLIGNNVIYNNQLYECVTAHTSSSTFDITKWETLSVEVTPPDLEKAIKYNAALIFYESPAGKNLLAKSSENLGGASSKGTNYDFGNMREYYIKTYESFRKTNI
jgi:hypothetical protein